MSYALSYDSPGAIPIGILGIYFILTIIKWLLKNAQVLRPQGPQQTDLTVQENPLSIEGVSKRDTSKDRVLRPDRTISAKTEVIDHIRDSGWNSDYGTINQHPTTDSHSTSQDASSKTNFWPSLPQGCDGPVPDRPPVISTNRGTGNDSQGVHQSHQIGKNTTGT